MVDIKKKPEQSAEQKVDEAVGTVGQAVEQPVKASVNLDKSTLVENTKAVEWEEQPTEQVMTQTIEKKAEAIVEPAQQKVVTQQLNGVVNVNNSSATIEGHNCPGIGQVRHSDKFIKAEQKVDELGTKLNGAIEKSGLANAANEVTDVLNNIGNKVTDVINGLTSGKKM